MPSFRIQAIETAIAEEVRAEGKAPRYGFPAHTEIARGHGPCRHCLRTFRVGEESRTLFTYDAFTGLEEVPLPGPVYIHTFACDRYPEDAGYPPDLEGYSVIFAGYGKGQRLVVRESISPGADKTQALEKLFAMPDVDYVEVRDGKAGCFDFYASR